MHISSEKSSALLNVDRREFPGAVRACRPGGQPTTELLFTKLCIKACQRYKIQGILARERSFLFTKLCITPKFWAVISVGEVISVHKNVGEVISVHKIVYNTEILGRHKCGRGHFCSQKCGRGHFCSQNCV